MSLSNGQNSLVCDRGLRREAIVRLLMGEIFQGRFRAGQRLVTQDLAVQFGVSHTPVREALIALAGIGVIDLLPNRGAAVRRVTVRDIREVCLVRRALECQAVRSACGHVARGDLRALAADFGRLARGSQKHGPRSMQRARQLDSQLHDLIADSCGNAMLARELNRLKLLFRAFRDVAWEYHGRRHDYQRVAEEAREHKAIVEALLAGDRRLASRAMSQHVRSGMKYWGRAVAASLAASNGESPSHKPG
jgi:DNA-binding GntR family transcriptional regulator